MNRRKLSWLAGIAAFLLLTLKIYATVYPLRSADQVLSQWAGLGYPMDATRPASLQTGHANVNTTLALVVAANATAVQRTITNTNSTGCWIGPSTVTNSTGYWLAANASVTWPGAYSIYGIDDAGNITLTWAQITP